MGNMVAFSVRHDRVDDLSGITFEDIGRLIYKSDNHLKVFQAERSWQDDFCRVTPLNGLISSHYYHADGGADLLFSSEWMMRLPYRFDMPRTVAAEIEALRKENPNADLHGAFNTNLLLKNLKKTVRNSPRKHPLRLEKAEVGAPKSPAEGASFSVFGYLTDCLSDLERNPKIMRAIIELCRTGKLDSKAFPEYSSAIQYLGTFGPETTCMVSMYHNSFFHFPMPFRQLAISTEQQQSMIEAEKARKNRWDDNELEFAGLNAIAETFGYQLKQGLAPAKESAWGPK